VSEHRPFQKQAIEALLAGLNVPAQMQRDLFAVRNSIVHGRTRSEIELEIRTHAPDFEMSEAVNLAWQMAFSALIDALEIPDGKIDRLAFGGPDSIVAQTLTFKAHMRIGMPGNPNAPRVEDVVVPRIEAIRTNKRGETIDPLTGELSHSSSC
jgi:hypothetical protein